MWTELICILQNSPTKLTGVCHRAGNTPVMTGQGHSLSPRHVSPGESGSLRTRCSANSLFALYMLPWCYSELCCMHRFMG